MDTALSVPLVSRTELPDEQRWLSAARLGQPWALEEFFRSYQGMVYSLCHRLLERAEDAEDATQATFVRAFRQLPRFRCDSSLKTWVYRIAVNEALGLLRRRKPAPALVGATEPGSSAEWREDSSSVIVEQLAVRAALARTTPAHRTVLVLRFWEDLSYEEIAGVLGISLAAVKMRLLRARQEFRRCYEEGS